LTTVPISSSLVVSVKNYLKTMTKKGFTLIELLIVIALLGTLAVALLAAIDPFEQFKKGTDTGIRNTVQEFYNAGIRYYAQRTAWPNSWAVPTPAAANLPGAVVSIADMSVAAAVTAYLAPLVDSGELKANFYDLASSQLQNMSMSVQDSTLLVCFKPQSKSFQQADKNTKFTDVILSGTYNVSTDTLAGSPPTGSCKSNSGATDCFWCIY
jgi:prepilin-type N-terminal cleavage/methylation domain-containing protein